MILHKKEKGSNFEREIAESLKPLDHKARRSLGSGAFGSVLSSDKSDIATDLPIAIECKRTEKLKPYEFYEQARAASDTTKIPVVAMRSNGKQTLALLEWKNFITLLEYALKNGFIGVQQYQKPTKGIRNTTQETASLPFSKLQQIHR